MKEMKEMKVMKETNERTKEQTKTPCLRVTDEGCADAQAICTSLEVEHVERRVRSATYDR